MPSWSPHGNGSLSWRMSWRSTAGPRSCSAMWCPQRRYEAIGVIASEGLPVQLATRVLRVSESGYYEWRGRAPSARAVRHAWLTEQIQAVHLASRGTYGSRRVHAELTLGLGITVGHGAIELLTRAAGGRLAEGGRDGGGHHPAAGEEPAVAVRVSGQQGRPVRRLRARRRAAHRPVPA